MGMPTRAVQRTTRVTHDGKSLLLSSHVDPRGQVVAIVEMVAVHAQQYARKRPKMQTGVALYLSLDRRRLLPARIIGWHSPTEKAAMLDPAIHDMLCSVESWGGLENE